MEMIRVDKIYIHRLSNLGIEKPLIIRVAFQEFRFSIEQILLISPAAFLYLRKNSTPFEINLPKDASFTESDLVQCFTQLYSLFFETMTIFLDENFSNIFSFLGEVLDNKKLTRIARKFSKSNIFFLSFSFLKNYHKSEIKSLHNCTISTPQGNFSCNKSLFSCISDVAFKAVSQSPNVSFIRIDIKNECTECFRSFLMTMNGFPIRPDQFQRFIFFRTSHSLQCPFVQDSLLSTSKEALACFQLPENTQDQNELALNFLTENFYFLDFSIFDDLPISKIDAIISSQNLRIPDEQYLYDFVTKLVKIDPKMKQLYKRVHLSRISPESVKELFNCMTFEELDSDFYELMKERLSFQVLIPMNLREIHSYFDPNRTDSSSADDGFKEILSSFSGSEISDNISLFSSSQSTSFPSSNILLNDNSYWQSAGSDFPSLYFVFHRNPISLNNYSIKHWGARFYFLRSWRLEGSNDLLNWTILDDKKDDETFSESNQIATFIVNDSNFFSCIRFVSTSNTSNDSSFVCLSRFSFYGSFSPSTSPFHNLKINLLSFIQMKYPQKISIMGTPASHITHNVSCLLTWDHSFYESINVPHSFVLLSFKEIKILAYAFRIKTQTKNKNLPRHIKIEGSEDKETYQLLLDINCFQDLHYGYEFTFPNSIHHPFSYFRFTQVEENHNKTNHFCIAAIEIVGEIENELLLIDQQTTGSFPI